MPVYSNRTHRAAVALLFFLQGICFSSWASRIPTIQQNLHLSDAALGAVLFSLPVGSMISLPLAGWAVAKLGSKKVVLVALTIYSLLLASLGIAHTIFQLIPILVVFGMAGNTSNIAVNTQAVGVEALYQRSIMASFHGLWSLAGFTGAAVGTIMIDKNVSPASHFLIIMIAVLLLAVADARFILPKDFNSHPDQPLFVKPDKSLINLGIIAFCSMICEGAMFDWSGVYFKKVLLVEKGLIGAGYTAFMCTMATGRFIADRFTSRFGTKLTLQLSGILTATGLLIAVALPHLITAIIGFLLVGFGVSSIVPLVFSAAGKSKVLSAGVALAAVTSIGFLGFLIGPPLIGIVAGITSLRVSFTIIALMGLSITFVASKSKW